MKKYLFIIFFITVFINPLAYSATPLRVGTAGDYPPLTYLNPQTNQFVGEDIERAKELGKYLGRPVVFVKTTWPTLSADLSAGKFDIAVGGISASPERQEKFLLSDPIYIDGKTPLVRCNETKKYANLQAINQSQVRVVENIGGTNQKFAERFLAKAKLILVKDSATTFDYLLSNKADVMITDRTEALYRQKTMPGLCAANPSLLLTHDAKIYLIPKSNPLLLTKVNHWLGLKATK